MKIKRYDAIRYCDMGGWSFSPDDIKECDDGELVKYDDAKAIVDGLQQRLDKLEREKIENSIRIARLEKILDI